MTIAFIFIVFIQINNNCNITPFLSYMADIAIIFLTHITVLVYLLLTLIKHLFYKTHLLSVWVGL